MELTKSQTRVIATYASIYAKALKAVPFNQAAHDIAYTTLCDIMTATTGSEYKVKDEFNDIDPNLANEEIINFISEKFNIEIINKFTEDQYKAILKASHPLRSAVMAMYHISTDKYTKDFKDGYINLINAVNIFEEELFNITGCKTTFANILEAAGNGSVFTIDGIDNLFKQDLSIQN